MTNADTEEIVRVASDGVTVEKSFDPDDFPVPAIAFSIRSDRDRSVTVRLVDTVPDDVAPENIGFHPKYGAEFWDVVDGSIVFEREFEPGEEYTTVYGLRGENAETPEKFLSEPRLESVDPPIESDEGASEHEGPGDGALPDPESTSDTDVESGSDIDVEPDVGPEGETELDVGGDPDGDVDAEARADAASDPEAGGDPAAGTEDEAENEDEDEGEPRSAVGSGADSEPDPEPEPDAADAAETALDDTPAAEGSLLETLADEIDERDPDDPELVALRDALGMDLTRASVEARIEHLQSTVADLEAYTDALEEFLDENGDAQQVLDEVRETQEETRKRLDEVEATAETAADEAAAVGERFDEEIAELRADVEAVETELEALSEELSEVVEMRDRLAEALGGLGGSTAPRGSTEPERGADDSDPASE